MQRLSWVWFVAEGTLTHVSHGWQGSQQMLAVWDDTGPGTEGLTTSFDRSVAVLGIPESLSK